MEDMSRQGLYIWLKNLVETEKCPGVSWLNKEEKTFQILWRNQKSRSWQKDDAIVFLEYAKHTCKYKKGDKMDFPKWKQNLKSAINKNKYIERVKIYDRLSGANPYRVYRFLDENARKKSDNGMNDVIKEEGFHDHLFTCESAGIVGDCGSNKDFLLPVRSSSTGSTFSENGSAFSMSEQMTLLPLSPDIPRDDVCEQGQGNIPTFVAFDFIPAEEDSTIIASSTSPGLYDNSQLNSQTVHQATAATSTITQQPVLVTVNSGSNNQQFLKFFLEKTQQGKQQQMTLPQTTFALLKIPDTDSGYYSNAQLNEVSSVPYPIPTQTRGDMQNLTYSAPDQRGSSTSTVHSKSSEYSTLGQRNDMNIVKVHNQSTGCIAVPQNKTILGSNDLSDPQIDDGVFLLLQKESVNPICDSNSQVTTTIPEPAAVSLSELGMSGSDLGILDQPSSMDTYEEPTSSDQQQFTTSDLKNCGKYPMSEVTHNNSSIPGPVEQAADNGVMHVEVLYGTPHRTVRKVNISSNRKICRLYFGAVNTKILQNEIKGKQDSEEVEFPSVDGMDFKNDIKDNIRLLLNSMELGIVISYKDDDIFVERRCLPHVFVSDGVSKSINLPRSTRKRPGVETKVFDFKMFNKSIEDYSKNSDIPVLKDDFILTIGYEIIPNDYSPMRKVPIYVIVRHVEAAKKRFNIFGASAIGPNPMMSDPNSFDKTIALFKEIDLKK